jgi:hypothetical protein
VKWEVQKWHAGDGLHEPYVGEPRPELEEAWKGLLGSSFNPTTYKQSWFYHRDFDFSIAVCRSERPALPRRYKAFNREENAIALSDGSAHLGTLNVYHEIHCIVSCLLFL